METESIYKYLPAHITAMIGALPPDALGRVNEIRLRLGRPLSATLPGANLTLPTGERPYICTRADIDETVSYVSASSMYAFGQAVSSGFIPLSGGGRAGICGDAVCSGNRVDTFGEITSICLRVPRFVKNAAIELDKYYEKNGLKGALVISPPGMGKTTYLKSAIYLLSRKYRVGVADEKYELSGGAYSLADVLTGCPKATAIELLTRTMSPQVIVCDEISSAEADGISAAANSGAALLASCHGDADAVRRGFAAKLIDEGVFSVAVRLYWDGAYKSELTEL